VRAEVGSLAMAGGTSDPVLLGGDEMFVPGLPVTVQVVGAVQRPTAVIYQKGALQITILNALAGCRRKRMLGAST